MGLSIADRTREDLRGVFAEAWNVRDPLTPDRWSEAYRIVPRGNAEPGAWRNARTPYLIEPMRMAGDPSVSQLSMMKGSQLGATDALLANRLGWAVMEDPGSELIILPTDRLAKRTVKLRLNPTIRASPELRKRFSTAKAESTMETLVFGSMFAIVCGSNSPTNLRSVPFRRVTIDDFDICEESAYEEGTQRMGSFDGVPTLMTCIGTPSFWERGIHAQYLAGDRRRYLVPCPHCGIYWEWLFDHLIWKGQLRADPGEVAETAYMRCPSCRGHTENHHKPWCLSWGCWQPDGVQVLLPRGVEPEGFKAWTEKHEDRHELGFVHPDQVLEGEPDHPARAHRSYRISSLYSPFKPFGWVAEGFIRAGGNPDKDWWNGKLGIPVKSRGEDVTLETVRKLCVPEELGGYKLGTVPEDVAILTTAIDVGSDHAWVLTVGYSYRMTVAYWIDARRIPAPRGFLKALAPDLLKLSFPHAKGGAMRPLLYFVDQGHRAPEVYQLCLALNRRRAFPIKGAPATAEAVVAKTFERGPDDELLPDSLTRLVVNTNHWSESVWTRVFTSAGVDVDERAEIMKAAEPELLKLPEDVPEEHLRMFTSEQCTKGIWEKKPGREDNHLVDLLRYAEAGMFRSGGRSLTLELAMQENGVPFWGWTPPEGTAPPTAIARAQRSVKQTNNALARRVGRKP